MRNCVITLVVMTSLLGMSGCGNPATTAAKKAAATDAKKKRKIKTANPEVVPGAATDKDKENTSKLMADGGRWKGKEADEDGKDVDYLCIYLPQGILNYKSGDDEMESGTWEVRDGYLIWSLDNVKTADKIKEINDKEFIFIDHETQKSVIETKVKD